MHTCIVKFKSQVVQTSVESTLPPTGVITTQATSKSLPLWLIIVIVVVAVLLVVLIVGVVWMVCFRKKEGAPGEHHAAYRAQNASADEPAAAIQH